MPAAGDPVTIPRLLERRLWVARLGELLRWWRTDDILGGEGAFVGPRLLPRTHGTARARIAFAVAHHACDERHPDPRALHLFRLDPETEDRLDALLAERAGDVAWWDEVLERLAAIDRGADVAEVLQAAGLVSAEALGEVVGAPLGPGGRSLRVPAGRTAEETVMHLTAGFSRSSAGALAVPWAREL